MYDLGSDALRAQLVTALVGTLVDGRRAAQRFEAGSSDAVFAEGTLGQTKDGGRLSTYKELCALATQLNQPDLIYQYVCIVGYSPSSTLNSPTPLQSTADCRFMHLANHNIAWNSRKGAAFGFARIATQATDQLRVVLPSIVPKLYR